LFIRDVFVKGCPFRQKRVFRHVFLLLSNVEGVYPDLRLISITEV
jgi:coenzyme F420-reducing hydrogenase gamma subunit